MQLNTYRLLLAVMIVPAVACVGSLDGESSFDSTTARDDSHRASNPVPPSASATVRSVGCGDVVDNLSDDAEALTAIFSEAVIPVDDPGTQQVEQLDCRITLEYRYDAGWQFRAPRAGARGYLALGEGASARLGLSATVDGAGPSVSRVFRGELSDELELDLDSADTFTPCGATSATVLLRLTGSLFDQGDGFGDDDNHVLSLDSEIDWRPCS